MSRQPVTRIPITHPWHSVHDIDASKQSQVDRLNGKISLFKALQAGVANAGQQQAALKLIVEEIAGAYDLSFRPGGPEGDRATAFAEGKRHVGNQIIRLVNREPATLIPKKT